LREEILGETNSRAKRRGGRCYVGFGPETNTVDLDTIPPELIVLHFSEIFLHERCRLDELRRIAEAL
jgi:hypothetical protein